MNTRSGLRSGWRRHVNPSVNERIEWVWWWARWFLALAGVVGGTIVFAGTSQLTFVYVNSAGFLGANLAILWLLRTDRLQKAMWSGFVIDTWVVTANWWTVLQIPDKGEKPSDLYLILFPFFIAVIVRVGALAGTAYAGVLTTLMVLGDLRYQGLGSYSVSQLPTRVLFLVITVAMTAALVARLQAGRESLRDAYVSSAANEERFRSLFESAPVGIALGDPERRFMQVNQALADLLGVPLDDFVGKRLREFGADTEENTPSLFNQLVSGDSDVVVVERRLRAKDGSIVWVKVVSSAVRDADGEFMYMIRIFEDITERRQMEQAKDEFLAMTSHELKSPITSIFATFKLLASGTMGDLPAGTEELLDGAERNAERLSSLVKDILDLQRLSLRADPLRLALCDGAQLGRNVVGMLAPVAQAAEVTLTVEGEPHGVYCDEERIEQVLTNLVSNAIKFSPTGSSVEVGVRGLGDEVEFAVRDDGPGLGVDQQEHAFEKFWQGDASDSREAGGSGLGLAIAKAIVEAHGGRISVESAVGEGAVFRFVLPGQSGGLASLGLEEPER